MPTMTGHAFLSVFTPSRTRPEDLEAITVQRRAIIEDSVERVRESANTGNKHHLLFVGPRGTGKTHLITLLVDRLGQDEGLGDCLRIAWLNEDETSTSLLELLRRVHEALTKRYPGEFAPDAIEPIFDLGAEEAENALARTLLDTLGERTLLVLVESLDALFEGLGQSGQHKLRAFIQENPVVSIVATAQRLVDDIAKRQSAFFGFFQTEHLKPLTPDEARELLVRIAQLNGQTDVVTFLGSAKGLARVRALHHLAGGNHRIYIVLSQFMSRDSIQALTEPFAKMVDEMTPYYQERIRWLPAQQRKIVEFLCSRDRPSPVKQIARRLFATPQTISSQLKDLRAKGYVQSVQRGRESLYELVEPMMRICLTTQALANEQLRSVIIFLLDWHLHQEPRDGSECVTNRIEDRSNLAGGLSATPSEAFRASPATAIMRGHWDEAMASLSVALHAASGTTPFESGDPDAIVNAIFESSLQPALRAARIRALTQVYSQVNATTALGIALVSHLGELHANARPLPSPDNLETWAVAWEDAGAGIMSLRLPLRIFRTGIDFLKTGGTDPGILLDLNQEERKLLEQGFGLDLPS